MSTTTINTPKIKHIDWRNIFYQTRHTICWVVLAAGSIAFIVQNAQRFVQGIAPFLVATTVVALVLYWGNRK